ncbi:DUF7159 family protein [Mycolicibacter algericus]|uniref:DUF7159 domain-containing protein n=2 Tax=Mycolicibacter algericus TaxID=1288388 RepID=A0A7I9YGI7_MYCAL|nr:hypothetical protein [Mycolicibacter algericus]OQZ98801.1 hypothetical protein BST10_04225 [Mycolicibacter algericus DSM 45454]GFG87613.1 hypothetical protein MALGJ_42890 [Mycolicibacter algericus]
MDIVLGVSTAPPSVRMVLVEGENAGGVTVDEDGFEVDTAGAAFPDQVVSAILGTQESAQQGGYRLASTGVTVADQVQAGQLRDALADRRVENVMLVSAFLAAAALAQTVGGTIGYERTALMFIEPQGATLAVVDSTDGSITEVSRVALPPDDDAALVELTVLAAQAGRLESRPDGLFVVGSGVNVGLVKPELDAVSAIPVSVPEEPDTALARGAALASAHAPLFDSSTSALAWARDPGTGVIDPNLVALAYAQQADYDATIGEYALAYSAIPDDADSGYLAFDDAESTANVIAADYHPPSSGVRRGDELEPARRRNPFLLAGSGLAAFFVVGVASLLVVLAVSIRPTASEHPAPSQHIVVPTQVVPAQKAPAPVPEVAPKVPPAAPVPAAPAPAAPAPPVAQAPAAPAPMPAAPAPAPAAPAPAAPAAPAPIPIPVPIQVPAPPVEIPSPAAPAPKQPELPPIFKPPAQSPPKNDNPSWLPGNNGGGNKKDNPSSLPGNNGGGNKGGNPSWLPGDNGGGNKGGNKGGNPSPWLPGVGTNGGGNNPWLPGLGGGGSGKGGWPF